MTLLFLSCTFRPTMVSARSMSTHARAPELEKVTGGLASLSRLRSSLAAYLHGAYACTVPSSRNAVSAFTTARHQTCGDWPWLYGHGSAARRGPIQSRQVPHHRQKPGQRPSGRPRRPPHRYALAALRNGACGPGYSWRMAPTALQQQSQRPALRSSVDTGAEPWLPQG